MVVTSCAGRVFYVLLMVSACSLPLWLESQRACAQPLSNWKAHDMQRPRPAVVTPGPLRLPEAPPSDAVVLFDGGDLAEWRSEEHGPAKWEVRDGAMVSVPGSGYVYSRRVFGDVQLHVEWSAPVPAQGQGQARGNSGVFLMSKYEIQVLDSYQAATYADGQAASVYGQYPPLANACLPPGEWQAFDIFFRRPRFRRDGALDAPARVTVIHNGVLVQDNVALWGPTSWLQHLPYASHPAKLPLAFQDHGNPVRYRNIWIRELREWEEPGPRPVADEQVIELPPETLARYVGRYQTGDDEHYTITLENGQLRARFERPQEIELVPHSKTEFSLRWTAARFVFELGDDERPDAVTFHVGGSTRQARRVE
jgi:hypothetical protein